MKRLFIYYSLTGNGDMIAHYLKNKDCDIRKVNTKEPLPNNYVLRLLSGGYKAMINYEDNLVGFNDNIDDYEEIIIGSPVWNRRLSSPINTVLKELPLKDKKLTFILYSGSGKAPKAEEFLNSKFPKIRILNLKEPIKNKKELEKIDI